MIKKLDFGIEIYPDDSKTGVCSRSDKALLISRRGLPLKLLVTLGRVKDGSMLDQLGALNLTILPYSRLVYDKGSSAASG
jgi:hypothetical protein